MVVAKYPFDVAHVFRQIAALPIHLKLWLLWLVIWPLFVPVALVWNEFFHPSDLAKQLKAAKDAAKNFEACGDSCKRNILRWIKLAKTDATRKARIEKAIQFAERNERIP